MRMPVKAVLLALFTMSFAGCGPGEELGSYVSGGESEESLASFEGRTIDLSKDWGEAKACLIWRQAGVVECFRSDQELDAREAQVEQLQRSRPGDVKAAVACSGSLSLYEHNNFQGRRLAFRDRGYWQNLGNYAFNDELSSYIVGPCSVHLARHANGGTPWYPGDTSANTRQSRMSSGWNDEVSSIYIL